MMSLSDDLRRLAAYYKGLAEQSADPRFREGFANLAARYDAIAAWREVVEQTAHLQPEGLAVAHSPGEAFG